MVSGERNDARYIEVHNKSVHSKSKLYCIKKLVVSESGARCFSASRMLYSNLTWYSVPGDHQVVLPQCLVGLANNITTAIGGIPTAGADRYIFIDFGI